MKAVSILLPFDFKIEQSIYSIIIHCSSTIKVLRKCPLPNITTDNQDTIFPIQQHYIPLLTFRFLAIIVQERGRKEEGRRTEKG